MKFHTLKGHRVRLGIVNRIEHSPRGTTEPCPWVSAQNRVGGRLQHGHLLFPAPQGWSEQEIVACLETFESSGGVYVGELGGLMVGFVIYDNDGDVMILSNLGNAQWSVHKEVL